MKKLKSVKAKINKGFVATRRVVGRLFNGKVFADVVNVLTVIAFTAGLIALAALIWVYVRPIQTANIKVPVATDQPSYHPGETIGGIFFGKTYFEGEVRILREVFCKEYKGVIQPPAHASVGDLFSTQAKARTLEGESVTIGNLPEDVPTGANCVLQFTNVYTIQTPFGERTETYQYYTQNFAIVTKERRLQLECEATGREDCDFIQEEHEQTQVQTTPQAEQSSPETQQYQPANQPRTESRPNNERPAEPAPRFEERCAVHILFVDLGCEQVEAS